ncbi:MAG: DUF1592 domain-containing protein [Verrucomicrobiota bacterium]
MKSPSPIDRSIFALVLASCRVAGTGLVLTWSGLVHANPTDSSGSWDEVESILIDYCFDCHDNLNSEGGFNLEELRPDFLDNQAAQHWIEVMDNINASEMPPEDKPQPSAGERALVAEWVAGELRAVREQALATGGRALLRRLTRTEYENTVVDLLGVVFPPKENPGTVLPPDGSIDGFHKVSQGLLLDPSLLDQYFEMAKRVADLAIQPGDPPVPTVTQRIEYERYDLGLTRGSPSRDLPRDKSISPDGTGVITWGSGWRTFGQLKHPYNDQMIPVSGRYAIRFRIGVDPGDRDEPMFFKVTRQGEGDLFYEEITASIDSPETYEVITELDSSAGGELQLGPVYRTSSVTNNIFERNGRELAEEFSTAGDFEAASRVKAQLWAEGHYGMNSTPDPKTLDTSGFPRTYIDYVELEGPLYDEWPPRSMKILFPDGFDGGEGSVDLLRDIISRLLPRAYRRPVEQGEIEQVERVALAQWEESGEFLEGVRAAIVTILCSPDFLYLLEPGDGPPRPLNEFELASRLSYFLWSTKPDEGLIAAAGSGGLASNLAREVDRLLSSPKSDALIDGFAAQWIKAAEFDRFEPDRSIYKQFYGDDKVGLNDDLNREPLEFIRHLLREDGDIRDLLDSDWTMANRRLARWYDLPGADLLSDEAFVPVSLHAESPRGGLVGMGAVHKWGSDGNRTKPVERGKYLLEVLFNDPPNPPPPNVGEVEPNVEGERLTVRERLEQHRSIKSCASCHSRLDPYGLALENFGVVGHWREYQDGEVGHWPKNDETRIDPSGRLPNGEDFSDINEFRDALRAMDDRFFLGFSEKLFTYATGRIPEPVDREILVAMVTRLQESGGSFRAAIHELVQSDAFLMK